MRERLKAALQKELDREHRKADKKQQERRRKLSDYRREYSAKRREKILETETPRERDARLKRDSKRKARSAMAQGGPPRGKARMPDPKPEHAGNVGTERPTVGNREPVAPRALGIALELPVADEKEI